jgi:bifunctional UDP-N-acetylglucosamine pyrophosphorylase/glucosamine-1-phosphate N-acetyltransferase/UDP-N-acetylglucosamine pyrophosphorylase
MDALSVIILAAGKGSRMKSDLPKVLHNVAGKPMILHVVACAEQVVPAHHIHVVVGHQAEKVRQAVSAAFPVNFCLQKHLLGTGDAVKCALPSIFRDIRDVVVLYGDVPLIQPDTVVDLVLAHRKNRAKVTVLAADLDQPTGYGRVLQDPFHRVVAIREEADASEDEKKIKRVNTGIYCFDRLFLSQALDLLEPDNHQAEYYLTDVVGIACQKNEKVAVKQLKDPGQALGINTLNELEKTRNLAGSTQNELP